MGRAGGTYTRRGPEEGKDAWGAGSQCQVPVSKAEVRPAKLQHSLQRIIVVYIVGGHIDAFHWLDCLALLPAALGCMRKMQGLMEGLYFKP